MPDDERKGRRLGDETKGRIADLASGWTVDSDAPPVPEPPIKREASGPSRAARDAPRRKAKTLPPPPPGSAARKALEDKIVELRAVSEAAEAPEDEAPELPKPPTLPAGRPPPVPPRARTPVAGVPRAPIDLSSMPEADKTKENRGAVGIKHDKSASLTANAASGTIGGDTPSPIFDRAAIAAGQRGALAAERASGTPPVEARSEGAGPGRLGSPTPAGTSGGPDAAQRIPDRSPGKPPSGTGPNAAVRSSKPATADRPAQDPEPVPGAPAPAAPRAPAGDDSMSETLPDALRRLTVPVGEFDHGETVLEQDKLRIAHAQATIKRDAANALLGVAEPAPAAPRPPPLEKQLGRADPVLAVAALRNRDASINDASGSATGRFERDDPTAGDSRGDATTLSPPSAGHAPTGTLRSSASLPRTRGIAGDLRYVGTVWLGLRRARRELAEIAARQATRQQSRRHHLITLGRAAAATDGFGHPALSSSREKLASIEDERSQHAGHVIAADAELTRVRRDREAKAKQCATDLAALDVELAATIKKLEPLEKEVASVKRRATDLHDSLRQIDAKIAATEASLSQARSGKVDPAEVQAELATLRADRKAIQSDEPVIAGQLDALSPRIAALEAARVEAQRRRTELAAAEQDDQRRVEELLAAIGAKRKVVDRAASDAEARRDKILFQLGDRLYVDRPVDLAGELSPIDEIDLELGAADRRMMELREIIASVDRWKVARGIALITLIVAAIGAGVGWYLGLWP